MNCSGAKTTTGIITVKPRPMARIGYGCIVHDLKVALLPLVTSNDSEYGQGISMDSQTVGHRQDSMGVRGHSAGDIFPSVIMIKGNPFGAVQYHIINHPRLNAEYGYHNFHAAHMAAQCTARF